MTYQSNGGRRRGDTRMALLLAVAASVAANVATAYVQLSKLRAAAAAVHTRAGDSAHFSATLDVAEKQGELMGAGLLASLVIWAVFYFGYAKKRASGRGLIHFVLIVVGGLIAGSIALHVLAPTP
jgi:hypothetical protein